MVRKNLVGAPLLKEKYIRDILLTIVMGEAMLIGTRLSTFNLNDFFLVISFFCGVILYAIYANKYVDRAYNLKEEWK